ncbi:MAG: glycoside hydrolase family 13 protein [Prochlorothrix sp.]|nr:glycoside hydrolase family 13 protein [Prochlorothrix sp.]
MSAPIPISTPQWVKTAVFYQIFPDSFARVIPDHQQWLLNLPVQAWEAPPDGQSYKGGTLWGILQHLDSLQDLGITALYLTPVFQSASNHRYHTHDYYQVDPLLGGNEALFALRDEIHRRNMYLVLDGVFNHASRGFFQFNDILENGPHSPWLDWFKIQNWPLAPYTGSRRANYAGWFNNRALPEFNHANPAVREYLMRVGEYWIEQGMDGWRLDVPFCITEPGFWQEFRQRIKAINPEAYITGEIFGDASQWLDGEQFDGVMNYVFAEATLAFAGGDRVQRKYLPNEGFRPTPALDASGYAQKITALLARYPWEIQQTQLNLLDSHDTARFSTILGADRSSILLSVLLLFTFPGAPCIYYGDEVGLAGGHDPDCRRAFPAPAQWDQDLRAIYQQIIQIRQQCPALQTGRYHVLYAEGLVYSFGRILDSQGAIILVNGDTTPRSASIDLSSLSLPPQAWSTGFLSYGTPTDFSYIAPTLTATLPPRSALIYTTAPPQSS